MPVEFELFQEEGYVECHWIGDLTQADMLAAYEQFIGGQSWKALWPGERPQWRELTNLSQMASTISDPGWAREQARFFHRQYRNAGFHSARVATLAPDDVRYGLSRVYQQSSEGALAETVRVFRDRQAAVTWLLQDRVDA